MHNMSEVIDRFIKYSKIDTQSSEETGTNPSTDKQFNLARVLLAELDELGVETSFDEEHCYVYGRIHANVVAKIPKLGFIAHMDTSPEVTDTDVKPHIIHEYDGEDINLNPIHNIVMKVSDFPELSNYVGKDLIVTDGTTLLGADDKAGIAEIMTMAHMLMSHPEIPHGEIRIAFTPDEEIGQGTDFFSLEMFDADKAYTVDGGALGEIEYENFNAAAAKVLVSGRSVHPGDAKGKMVNSMLVAMEYNSMLPEHEIPSETEGYEGFYHLTDIDGTIEETHMSYIIRDHDKEKFEKRKKLMADTAVILNKKRGGEYVTVVIKDSYYNMKEKIEPHMELIENAKLAMEEEGATPKIVPIRGGTDGAMLSFRGLPCPNLSTGGMNYHGRFEYACVQDMETMAKVLIRLATARKE